MSFWDMSDRQALRWERKRKLGRLRFTLVYGVVFWGGGTAVLAAVLDKLFGNDRTLVDLLSRNLVAFPITGLIFFGPVVWVLSESNYQSWLRAKRHAKSHHG